MTGILKSGTEQVHQKILEQLQLKATVFVKRQKIMLATLDFKENPLVLLEMAAKPATGRDRQARVAQTGQPSRAFFFRDNPCYARHYSLVKSPISSVDTEWQQKCWQW
jgi:hypothetical protein